MKISFAKKKKGEYGYLNYQHFESTLKTLLTFLVALAIFYGGYLYYGVKENIVTVLSVLTLLPASHMLVLCIMHWRFSTGSDYIYNKVKESYDEIPIFYDSVITVEKGGAYPINVFACLGKSLIGYTDKNVDVSVVSKHIKTMLRQNQIEGISVKLFTDEESFLNRLGDLYTKFNGESEEDMSIDIKTIYLIKALSL